MTDKQLHLIGIAGDAQCGKDTAADYICKISNTEYRKESFANPIKDMLGLGLGMNHAQLHGDLKDVVDERFGKTPRHMLQTLGTEWGRDLIHPNVWVFAMKSYLESGINLRRTHYIVPDVRFENEANFIRQHGTLIHIRGREDSIDANTHISEMGVDIQDEDIVIQNDSSLNNYLMRVCDAYHTIVRREK